MLQLNVGQAGGQIGSSLSRLLGPTTPGGLGCLFVDSEPKVVCPLVDDSSPQRIPYLNASSIVYDHNGRGNNWAWGYSSVASRQGLLADPKLGLAKGVRAPLLDRAMMSLRKHAEALDNFDSLILLHSTGGGTGSGFGCRLLEAIRDEYGPSVTIVDALVTPFASGDTPLQHYNTVLTMAAAVEHADAVLVLNNDDLLARARVAKAGRANLAAGATPSAVASSRARVRGAASLPVSVPELNAVAAEALAGILLPTRHRKALRRAGSSAPSSPSSSRPQWVDVSTEAAAPRPFEASPDKDKGKGRGGLRGVEEEQDEEDDAHESDEERYGERGGWIAASVRASKRSPPKSSSASMGTGSGRAASSVVQAILSASSIDQVLAVDDSTNLSSAPSSRPFPGVECPVDMRALVRDLVGDQSKKLLDVRTVAPMPVTPGGRAPLPDSPASSWMALADTMTEAVPRYDSSGCRVTTHAARLVARGTSQVDADSVDPSLGNGEATDDSRAPAKPNRGMGGSLYTNRGATAMRRERLGQANATQPHWPGLPTSHEWSRVSTVLSKALYWPVDAKLESCRTALLSPGQVYSSSLTPPALAGHCRTLTLASNCDVAVPSLVHAVACAEALLSVGAYVHWYERYGVSSDRLARAMETVLDVVEAYRPGATGASAKAAQAVPSPTAPRPDGLLARYGVAEDDQDDGYGYGEGQDGQGGDRTAGQDGYDQYDDRAPEEDDGGAGDAYGSMAAGGASGYAGLGRPGSIRPYSSHARPGSASAKEDEDEDDAYDDHRYGEAGRAAHDEAKWRG